MKLLSTSHFILMSIWLNKLHQSLSEMRRKNSLHLGNYASKAFDLSYNYIIDLNEKVAEKGHKTEEAINTIDEKLTRYLITLSSEALSQKESEVLTNILDSSRDLERIGDHAEAPNQSDRLSST